MPKHDTINIAPNLWKLVAGSVTSLRLQNLGPHDVEVQVTDTDAAPSSDAGSLILGREKLIADDTPLSTFFPGVSDAAYVWVRSKQQNKVSVSHA